jgi:hypothetical protein
MKLTENQENFIKENHSSIPDLIELTRKTFDDPDLDGRTKEGRAVRSFLVGSEISFNTTKHEKRDEVELSTEEKEFIDQYAKEGMSAYEISKILFPEVNVTNLSKEVLVVAEYLKDSSPEFVSPAESAMNVEYHPPRSPSRIIKKINDYATQNLDEKKLTRSDQESVETLGRFLDSPRFLQVMNTYTSQGDRDLFEAEFIRATWDKTDLTVDEVNLYINVCMDYIHLKNISRAIDKLNRMFEECEDQRDMTVRLAELLKTKSEEYNQCEKRMESLIMRLNGDRKERIKNQHKNNASILSLVKLFQSEQGRKRMVAMAEKQKLIVSSDAERLEDMESWKARVLGISKDEAI